MAELKELTQNQIDHILTTWAIPSANPVDSGELILLSFFEKYPHNQTYFKTFKNVPLESLKGSAGFRVHASKVVNVLNDAVICLKSPNYLEELKLIWAKIGESHAKRKISKTSFNELRLVLLQLLTEVCSLTDEQQEAWTLFVDNIYNIIFNKLDTHQG